MDKQKQIEELAKEVYENSIYSEVMSRDIARYIVKNDYHKGETVSYQAMVNAQNADRWQDGYEQGKKETAEKFAERLKSEMQERDYMGVKYKQGVFTDSDIDEICKEIKEGKL